MEKKTLAESLKMSEAEQLFNDVLARCLDRWRFILSFRTTSKLGMEGAKEEIEREKISVVTDMLQGQVYDKIFIDKQGFFEENPPEKLVQSMTEQTLLETEAATDAASIVFAHSVLDGAVFDYCKVTALVSPKDWEAVVEKRQVTLAELRGTDYDRLLKERVAEFLKQLERESIFIKAGHLFARCKPPEKWSPMHNYIYDKARLEKIDQYRHEIIHGRGINKKLNNTDEEVEYLMKTALFFMGLVNLRYGLKITPEYTFAAMAEFSKA